MPNAQQIAADMRQEIDKTSKEINRMKGEVLKLERHRETLRQTYAALQGEIYTDTRSHFRALA